MNVNRGKMTAAAVLAVTLFIVGGVTRYGFVFTHLCTMYILKCLNIA